MKIYTSLSQVPTLRSPISLIIGTFDGVHKGHKHLFNHLKQRDGSSVVVTFSNHPQSIIKANPSYPTIYTLEQKIKALSYCGIDILITLAFTNELREMDYKEFIQILHESLGFHHLYRGENDVLGKNRSGNLENIRALGKLYRYSTHEIKKLEIDKEIVSSTLIKKYLRDGNIEKSEKLLGRPISFYEIKKNILQEGSYLVTIRYFDESHIEETIIDIKENTPYLLPKEGEITILEKRT